ncbi:unnamed protein product [Rotaria magnacalcarata]|uniref:Uncharacterized protein n=1 Tax=Rotaria magnacalcarata TaxID=392030 RepID=A0A816MY19_9BILA|nr:unnamed protein product [Rotaria magnacalcarata]CAF3763285.1 unnamed protein product [Rotaria magnacalcarata]
MQKKQEYTLNTQQNKKAEKRIIAEVIIAIILIAPAILLCVGWRKLIISLILQKVELKPNSVGFQTWLHPPTTITRGYHLFNISNPREIVTDPTLTTINLKETRAYSYSLSATKQDIQWSDDNKSISYSIHRLFTRHPTRFDPSSVHDTGVFIDLVRAIFRTSFGHKPSQAFYALAGKNTFYRRNAVEQLEGFNSDLFETVREKMTGPNTAKSGFIYRYNGSRSYNYTIKSGLMEKGQVLAFASENAPYSFSSPNPYGFPIYDGLTFVPMLFNKPSLNIFQADFCRPLHVKFNRVLSMFEGIEVHEYVIKLVDLNQCTDPNDSNTCPELDKLDISQCISDSLPKNTVFLSKPHFYGISNETRAKMNIEGFAPTREEHEALIYFEPYSGTPLRAHHRLQLNIDAMIDPMKISDYESEPTPTGHKSVKRLLPLVWIDQEVNVNNKVISMLRWVHLALRYGQVLIMVLAIALAIIIIVIVEVIARRKTNSSRIKRNGNPKSDLLL